LATFELLHIIITKQHKSRDSHWSDMTIIGPTW